jgi:hypothetical protein
MQQLQEKIEELTIKISNRNKQNQSNEENIIPSNTTVKIDLQSNHEEVHRSLFTLEMCRSYY